jgi:hypothetical protein
VRSVTISKSAPAVALLFFLAGSCGGSRLPKPPTIPNHQSDPSEIATHPPPAALPEIVSERPSKAAQWLPGVWIWQEKSWVWKRGGWIENPGNARLVESQVRYTRDGTLLYYRRRWVEISGAEVDEPEIVRPAATPPIPRLPEEDTIP